MSKYHLSVAYGDSSPQGEPYITGDREGRPYENGTSR